MRLRHTVLLLSLLALTTILIGGYQLYTNVRMTTENRATSKATRQLSDLRIQLSSFLAEQLKPGLALAELKDIHTALKAPSPTTLAAANLLLDNFALTLGADVCYLMRADGQTIASSNRQQSDSFVGKNFSFRPYFQRAMRGSPATYMALGTTSHKRGVYYSSPVVDRPSGNILGVAVIKASVSALEEKFPHTGDDVLLLTDPHGIIFISNRPGWLFRALWPLSETALKTVAASRQFGHGPWPWLGFTHHQQHLAVNTAGSEFQIYQQPIGPFPDWSLVYLRTVSSPLDLLISPMLRSTGVLILPLLGCIAFAVFFLYRRAAAEITQRRAAEEALRQSETRYRTLYMHTPAMLHSIDPSGVMLSISDYWQEGLGYSREEVIGRQVLDFMTPQSRSYAEHEILPQFFQTGFCKNIPYQFIKKDGTIIDVLLSAIAERDQSGTITRSLAILVDITELKRVEAALKSASEELSRYSRELERQVRERSREISHILQYTPAVIYLKDIQGRYLLVNSRFEQLYLVTQQAIRGRTDVEIFGPERAAPLIANDRQVLEQRQPLQAEETIDQEDGPHTFLSVKFPLFDEEGKMYGIGGISTDITALKKAEEQLRQLSGSILAGQERERAAIARELHDELGQLLTALRMDAVWVRDKTKTVDQAISQRARSMATLIDRTIDEVRTMAIRLRPGVLDDLGLIAAMQWLIDDFESRSDISCTFRHHEVGDLDDRTATAVYRITQEALTNIARHAQANHGEVILKGEDHHLLLQITDDGRGIDPELSAGDGLGLTGIKERARLLGAAISISSSADDGTRIQVVLPCVPNLAKH